MFRTAMMYTWVAVAIAAIYTGYTLFARHDENAKLTRQATEQDAEEARKEVDRLGGDSLKILQFYAPQMLAKGQKGQLCYGVANAKTVALEPAVERVWPALSRCIEISPAHDTEYTLTAKDDAGHSRQQTLAVQVR